MTRFLPGAPDPHRFDPDPPAREMGAVGVLLINLGTPDEPTPGAIRRYLAEFLSDRRVIELPPVLWQLILRGVILPRRPRKLAPRYKEIWLESGSPLLVHSQNQTDALGRALDARHLNARVALGMRYGGPSVTDALAKLRGQGCERILVVPMYPQYAASTTATAVDAVTSTVARWRDQPELRFVKRFYDHPGYVSALVRRVRAEWVGHGKPDRLLLSFHGLPRAVVEQGDPYFRDCMDTARLVRHALGAEANLVHVAFQSRFGAQKWLEPYTLPTLRQWARQGVGRVDVMCPGFLADCLETLEEIQMQCRDAFLSAGGREFRYIPCLNGDEDWADALADLVTRHLSGWVSVPTG